MKAKPILKWLALVGGSAVLSVATANADPDPGKKDNKDKPEQVEKKAGDNSDKKADNRERANPTEQRQERAEDRQEQREDRKERVEDRRDQAENRQERVEDRREKTEDRKERVEDRRERVEDRQERAEDRAERRIYKRGEFRERLADRDRDQILTYFSGHKGHSHGLPPGLASKWASGKRLPAGWRDRLVIGYVIEDDWRPYFEPVPYSWFPGITVIPDTQLYWYGDRIVRVYEPTREIVDVVVIPTIHIDL